MKVFLSWSGKRSRMVAQELGSWLKKVVQSVEPWISTDMERGVKWMDHVNASLDSHSFGIICITPGNVNAPWINYEAGALAKHLADSGRVIPYLLGFRSPSDLKDPLGQFNAALADEDGTWQIVKTLNKHAEFPQGEGALQESFELWWPKLRVRLEEIKAFAPPGYARRPDTEKIDDILEIVREIRKGSPAPKATDRLGSSTRNDISVLLDELIGPMAYYSTIEQSDEGAIHISIPDRASSTLSAHEVGNIIKERLGITVEDIVFGSNR